MKENARKVGKACLVGLGAFLREATEVVGEVWQDFRTEQEKQRQENNRKKLKLQRQKRLEEIRGILSDRVARILNPNCYNWHEEDVYGDVPYQDENGQIKTYPDVVGTKRMANVYIKGMMDCANTDVFRVDVFGKIPDEDLDILRDIFKTCEDFKYTNVGIVVGESSKQLVFCGTNDSREDGLVRQKLASRNETRVFNN